MHFENNVKIKSVFRLLTFYNMLTYRLSSCYVCSISNYVKLFCGHSPLVSRPHLNGKGEESNSFLVVPERLIKAFQTSSLQRLPCSKTSIVWARAWGNDLMHLLIPSCSLFLPSPSFPRSLALARNNHNGLVVVSPPTPSLNTASNSAAYNCCCCCYYCW